MKRFLLLFLVLGHLHLTAQDELLSLFEDEETIDYITAGFKTNRVINLHSIENTAKGVLDVKISHRFGFINQGVSQFFGLDNATIRLGLDFGVTDRFAVGFGRSSFEKTIDGFLKYKVLRQSKGAKNMPITAAIFSSMAIKTAPFEVPDRKNYVSSKMFYAFQAIVGRKFSESFSFQLSPTLVHRNLIATNAEKNDVFALGMGLRQKLTKRLSLNLEYIYVFPDQLLSQYKNSFSIGFDVETGGHVFQLHFTNSTSMIEKGFVGETTGDWLNGGIHFGFNISRVFTLYN